MWKIVLILILILSGCSNKDTSEKYTKQILYLGNDELLTDELSKKNLNFSHNTPEVYEFDIVITDKEYIQHNNGEKVIKEFLERNITVFIYGFSDTKYIQKVFLNSESYDETKDNSYILVEMKNNNNEIKITHYNYGDKREAENDYGELVKKILEKSFNRNSGI